MHHPHMGWCDTPTINEKTMNHGIKIILLLAAALPGTRQALAQEVKDTTGTDVSAMLEGHCAAGVEDPDVFTVVMEQQRLSEQLLEVAWLNPAMKPLQHRHSLSEVVAKFSHSKQSATLDVQQGNKQQQWSFDASTYVKHGKGTLWGRAYYDNGGIYHMNWNETSDLQQVYPYLLADSVGGHRMNVERYSFMGGYAHKSGRLLWGASLGYTAGLYYRKVDPRPRNVTANLDVDAGIGWLAPHDYVIAAAIRFKKYKQTNDVTFYSELGNEKLYHLTGFANSYTRFDGTGYSTYYKGYRWGAVLNIHPTTGCGPSAAVELSRFTFDKILTAFNKLPLTHAAHHEVRAELAWRATTWQVKAQAHASRRVGTENVFGDPAASVYRQIGALDMFFENRFGAGLAAVWEPQLDGDGKWSAGMQPSLVYEHCNAIYVDPASRWLVNHVAAGITAKVMNRVGSRLLWSMNAWFKAVCPVKSELLLGSVTGELEGLKQVVESGYDRDSHHHNTVGGELALHYRPATTKNLAVKLAVKAQHSSFTHGQSRNEVLAALGVCF